MSINMIYAYGNMVFYFVYSHLRYEPNKSSSSSFLGNISWSQCQDHSTLLLMTQILASSYGSSYYLVFLLNGKLFNISWNKLGLVKFACSAFNIKWAGERRLIFWGLCKHLLRMNFALVWMLMTCKLAGDEGAALVTISPTASCWHPSRG